MGVVATPLVKRPSLFVLVAFAAAALLAAAWWGSDDRRSLSAFVPAGPMRATDQASVRRVEVRKGDSVWRFERDAATWRATPGATPTQLHALDDGLALLRNAAPERRFEPNERPDDAAAGLAPPALIVRIEAQQDFQIEFGGVNPIGLARYARIAGDSVTLLLPRYVADMWEAAVGLREPPAESAR
jgi:hypothetical protein